VDLTPYVIGLREQLAAAAEAGGPEARELAERLAISLESAVRLTLLDALSAAASEITRDLAPGSVDLRLRGREPSFVVTALPAPPAFQEPNPVQTADPARSLADGDESAMTRINLRLSQELKDRVDEAAREAGLSVNAWLVRSATAALSRADSGRPTDRRDAPGSDRHIGWVR
jgi:hypothetical protein